MLRSLVLSPQDTSMDLQQLDNWIINARVRVWRPMVQNVFKDFIEGWINEATVRALGAVLWFPFAPSSGEESHTSRGVGWKKPTRAFVLD